MSAATVTDLASVHAVTAFDSRITPLLTAAQAGGGVGVFHLEAEPRSGPPLHRHEREDELFYVLTGTVGFLSDGRRWTGGPGTLAYLPRGSAHTWANLSERHARLLVLCQPGGFEGYLLEAAQRGLDPAAAGDALAELGTRYGIALLGANPLLKPAAKAAAAPERIAV